MSQMRFVVWLLVSAKSKTSSPCGLGLNLMKLFWYFSSPFKIISFILPRSIISVQNMLVCPKMVYESIYLMKLLFVVCLLCCMFLIGFMNLSDEITTFVVYLDWFINFSDETTTTFVVCHCEPRWVLGRSGRRYLMSRTRYLSLTM